MSRPRILTTVFARPLAAAISLLAVSVAVVAVAASPLSSPAKLHVRLIIDYNDGVQKHFTAIPWTKDMTVLEAMKHAQSVSHGISFEYTGSGETAFVKKIDDLKNQGRRPDAKSWLYWVNTDFGTKSFGVRRLNPSDVVLWRYDTYKDE